MRKLRPDFPQENLVKFSRGQTTHKSRNDLSKTKPGIFNSNNGKFIKLQSRPILWKYWDLIFDKAETQRIKGKLSVCVCVTITLGFSSQPCYKMRYIPTLKHYVFNSRGKDPVHEGFSFEKFLHSNETEDSKNFSHKIHSKIYHSFYLTI